MTRMIAVSMRRERAGAEDRHLVADVKSDSAIRTISNLASKAIRICAFLTLTACGGGGGGGGGDVVPPFDLYSSVAVADVDGDGLPDVVAVYAHISGPPPHPGFVAVYLQNGANPGHFLPASVYPVGNDPVWVAIGDLNGDGRPDIATANAILATNGLGASTVSVLLQDPAQAGRYLPAANYATGFNPVSVAIGDLNGDGKPDLAVADSSGISVLFQDAGGTFLPKITIATGAGCASVSIVDLNGDGEPDLLATDAASVLVLLQNAGGGFAAPVRYAAGQQPVDAVAGDLNHDGKPDIAVANLGSPSNPSTASVSVLMQDATRLGAFVAAVTYATQARSTVVAIADLDGDGSADLAVANSGDPGGDSGVSVLLQDGTAAGHLGAAVNYAATGNDFVTSVAVADVDGDGKADLVVLQSNGVFIRLQDALHPGQFLSAQPIPE